MSTTHTTNIPYRYDWEDEDVPRRPRRRINGVTWEYGKPMRLDVNGITGYWTKGNAFRTVGFAMGVVKDDEDDRDLSERIRAMT